MDRKTIENAYRIYQKKHGGSIAEISILFVNVTEALSEAAEHSAHTDAGKPADLQADSSTDNQSTSQAVA